jgi:hypothetical protein
LPTTITALIPKEGAKNRSRSSTHWIDAHCLPGLDVPSQTMHCCRGCLFIRATDIVCSGLCLEHPG